MWEKVKSTRSSAEYLNHKTSDRRVKGCSRLCNILLVALLLLSCSGAEDTVPVALPVPFSGSLTPETNVLISEGNPVPSLESLLNLSVKNQSQNDQFPLTWNLLDSNSGVSNGTVTFNSMSNPDFSPAPGGGVKRVYTMDACATLGTDREACSANFKCFDLPTDYIPSAELVSFASTLPGTSAEVRKLYCSGNIDRKKGDVAVGELLDGKFVIGSACTPGEETCFLHTQLDSAVIINGTTVTTLQGDPDANVVFTLFTQGGVLPVPDRPMSQKIDILSPGTLEKIGDWIGTLNNLEELEPNSMLLKVNADAEFRMNDGSFLLVHHVEILTHRLPELDETVRGVLQSDFSDAPGVTPRLLQEGVLFFNTTGESHSDPINCDPAAGEATGTFQTLCGRFPRMRVNFLCTTAGLDDPNAIDAFQFTGVWTLVKE